MTVYYSMNIWLHSMVSMSSRGHEYHRTSLAFVWDTYSTKPMINWKLIGWRWRVAGSHAYFCSLRYYSAKRWLSSPIGGWMLQWALLITPFGRWYCSGLYWHRSHNTEVTQAPFHSSHSHIHNSELLHWIYDLLILWPQVSSADLWAPRACCRWAKLLIVCCLFIHWSVEWLYWALMERFIYQWVSL